MAIVTTGPIGSVSGIVPFSSVVSYDYFSGVLSLTTAYAANELDFGRPCKEVHIVNPTANPIQFRFEEWFTSSKDGGMVQPGATIVLRNVNRKKMQLRCDAGAIAGAYVMAF